MGLKKNAGRDGTGIKPLIFGAPTDRILYCPKLIQLTLRILFLNKSPMTLSWKPQKQGGVTLGNVSYNLFRNFVATYFARNIAYSVTYPQRTCLAIFSLLQTLREVELGSTFRNDCGQTLQWLFRTSPSVTPSQQFVQLVWQRFVLRLIS